MPSTKFSSKVGENVDYMENLAFSSWVEISAWYAEVNFSHVIAI